MAVTQDNRLLSITTPLGKDVLLLEHFEMEEAISTPFSIRADVLCELSKAPTVTAKALIGKDAVIRIELPEKKERFFHGMIRTLAHSGKAFAGVDDNQRFVRFQLEIVPKLARLHDRTDCRIFQDRTPDFIIQAVLFEMGIDVEPQLQNTYTNRDYCVQYRESSLDFVHRLMEEEGMHYFFKHSKGGHKMVLADKPAANLPCPVQSKVNFEPEGGVDDPQDAVQQWSVTEQLRSGSVVLRDHHPQLTAKTLEFEEETQPDFKIGQNADLELYDYPGGYAQHFNQPDARLGDVEKEGPKIARLRMQEEEASYQVVRGLSTARDFVSGFRFTLQKHFLGDYNIDWLITSVNHSATQSPNYVTGDPVPNSYSNSLTCMPHKVPYIPGRVTPRPIVNGPQTAIVVGKAGEEIWPDKYGRVKVQFFWDRNGQHNENSSCWIRVATPWAGKQWGMIHIPRIGQEVVVQFLEGDPSKPVIIGSLYNNDQMPPYTLPDNKTQSGVKSRSSLGGGSANFNEIRFEDKKGKEQVYIHAEKNLDTVVENSETRSVGNNRTTTIHKNDKLTVEKENLEILVQEGDASFEVSKGDSTIDVNMGNRTTKVPLGTDKLEAKEVLIKATTHIKIECGGSSIEMTPANITIKAPMVLIN